MQFKFKPMDAASAQAIAAWQYEGIYAFYDLTADAADMAEFLDPQNWPDSYYAVFDEKDTLVGFFCFAVAEKCVEIALGLRPQLTGQGLGRAFLESGLRFAEQKYRSASFCLSVAAFNQRAIKVYEKVGFQQGTRFLNETNGGQFEFLRMFKIV